MDELGRQTYNFGILPKLEMKHDETEEILGNNTFFKWAFQNEAFVNFGHH